MNPSFLFLALARYDAAELEAGGLNAGPAEAFLLYEELDAACEAIHPAAPACLVMVHAERMTSEGHTFLRISSGVWQISRVPPEYLWISEQPGSGGDRE